jgi:hypothetical protein
MINYLITILLVFTRHQLYHVLHISFLLLILDSHLNQQLDIGISSPRDFIFLRSRRSFLLLILNSHLHGELDTASRSSASSPCLPSLEAHSAKTPSFLFHDIRGSKEDIPYSLVLVRIRNVPKKKSIYNLKPK